MDKLLAYYLWELNRAVEKSFIDEYDFRLKKFSVLITIKPTLCPLQIFSPDSLIKVDLKIDWCIGYHMYMCRWHYFLYENLISDHPKPYRVNTCQVIYIVLYFQVSYDFNCIVDGINITLDTCFVKSWTGKDIGHLCLPRVSLRREEALEITWEEV